MRDAHFVERLAIRRITQPPIKALGAALGAGVGVLVWQRMASEPTELHGPLEVPWTQLAGVLALGTLTAVAAALVTARGLARLDLVGSLRGSLRSAPVRKGAPVLGGVLVGAGLVGVWLAMLVAPEWRFLLWTVSALAVLIGVLLVLGGVIIALIGVVGEYIGRIYLSINRCPQYVVRNVIDRRIPEPCPTERHKPSASGRAGGDKA